MSTARSPLGARPMLKRLYDWLMELASSPHAIVWLALVAFAESSFFPIPPDVMLIPMILAHRRRAWLYAGMAVAASVAGGWLGYGFGYYLYETIGRTVIDLYRLNAEFDAFQTAFVEYGAWIVLLKGATPIPYKLVTIAAGAAHLDPVVFTLASIGSRAMRFFLVAALLWKFGEPIRDFIEKRLILATTLFVVVLVGGFLVLKFV
ncbi:cytochrome b561 [Alphaproteobacteria bacterium]|nr:cytochrome b561 [Alphaproteobacteria bacterium]